MASFPVWAPAAPDTIRCPFLAVYVKAAWADSWTYVPWLIPEMASEGRRGKGHEAIFHWYFGEIDAPGTYYWDLWPYLTIGGWYIAINAIDEYGETPLWIGVVEHDNVQPWGTEGFPAGEQEIRAVGLNTLLARRFKIGDYALVNGSVAYIDRPLRGNAENKDGLGYLGNMSPAATAYGPYCFYNPMTGDTAASLWCHQGYIDYILGFFINKKFEADGTGPEFYLTGFTGPLADLVSTYDFEGQNCESIIDRLIPESRGLGYRIVTDGVGPVWLDVYSMLTGDNNEVAYIDIRSTAIKAEISFPYSQQYDTIEVIGEPIVCCCTFAFNDARFAPLVELWSAAQEAAYTAIAAADKKDGDAQRGAKAYDVVFQAFGPDPAWDWTIDGFNCNPGVLFDGTYDFTISNPIYSGSRRFLPDIPVYTDTSTGEPPKLRQAFLLIKITSDDLSYRYYYADKLEALKMRSVNLSLRTDAMTFMARPSINHVAAKGIISDDIVSSVKPQYSYLDYFLTAAFETDTRLRVRMFLPPLGEVRRVKTIYDRDAKCIFIAPGTILDVDPSDPTSLIQQSGLYVFRDFMARLQQKALLAGAWAIQQRGVCKVEIPGITLAHMQGSILTGVADAAGFTAVGTAVTSRGWRFDGDMPLTVVQTAMDDTQFDNADIVPRVRPQGAFRQVQLTPVQLTPVQLTPARVTPL